MLTDKFDDNNFIPELSHMNMDKPELYVEKDLGVIIFFFYFLYRLLLFL